jgi:hypothetical protein
MKKWNWILLTLGVGVSLFLWTIRENFQDTATLRGPPYGDSDYPIIVNLMSPALVTKLQDKVISESPNQNRPDKGTLEGQRKLVDGTISSLMGDFHTTVYQPATKSLKEAEVDKFLNTKATSGFLADNKAELKKLLVAYFVTQPAGAVNKPSASSKTASNSGYSAVLTGLGQTGGSGINKKGNIWGPAYTGMGDNAGNGGGSGVRDYPTLLGPKPKESKMVEGGGIANLSKQTTLPSSASTGSDPNSQFFGTSRSPGDKDLFPNPYLEFTPSSGSSKTEPVPYLADFSAFLN